MKIIKKENKDFQIGQKVRVKKYEEVREIYDKISISSLPKDIYGNIYTIKDVKKIEHPMDDYRLVIISIKENGYEFYPFEFSCIL